MQETHFKRRQGLAKEGAFGKSIWQREKGIWHGNKQMPIVASLGYTLKTHLMHSIHLHAWAWRCMHTRVCVCRWIHLDDCSNHSLCFSIMRNKPGRRIEYIDWKATVSKQPYPLFSKTNTLSRLFNHQKASFMSKGFPVAGGSYTTTGINAASFWNATTTIWSGTLSTRYGLSVHQAETAPWHNWIQAISSFIHEARASSTFSSFIDQVRASSVLLQHYRWSSSFTDDHPASPVILQLHPWSSSFLGYL